MSDFKGTNGKWIVQHSISKTAWNVVGQELGGRHKIARLPYLVTNNPEIDIKENQEQYFNAKIIAAAPDLLISCKKAIKDLNRLLSGQDDPSQENLLSIINQLSDTVGKATN